MDAQGMENGRRELFEPEIGETVRRSEVGTDRRTFDFEVWFGVCDVVFEQRCFLELNCVDAEENGVDHLILPNEPLWIRQRRAE